MPFIIFGVFFIDIGTVYYVLNSLTYTILKVLYKNDYYSYCCYEPLGVILFHIKHFYMIIWISNVGILGKYTVT